MFKKLYNNKFNELSTAIGQLTVGALFFGMRSCEYSKVTSKRKTEIIKIKHVRFFNNRREINKSRNMDYKSIQSVTITFVKQKNGDKEADRTMHRTNNELCPVKAWVEIVSRILGYPDTNENTTVNYVLLNNTPCHIDSKQVLTMIRLQITVIGQEVLGFGPDDAGTHSIRSSFAMVLHLAGKDPLIIMLQERWRSQAFMDYIRPQVAEFSTGLSEAMMTNHDFYHIPEIMEQTNRINCIDDPCVSPFDPISTLARFTENSLQSDRKPALTAPTSLSAGPHWI